MAEPSQLAVQPPSSVASTEASKSFGSTVARGTAWVLLGFALSQIGRLLGNVLLAALLFQEAFALMAVVSAVIQGLAMFSDIGLGPNIVQNKRGDEREFLDTAWTLQVIRGVVLAGLATACAWPLAAFYAQNDPEAWKLLWLMPLVAISMLVDAFQSTKLKTAARHVNLGRVTLIDLGSQLSGLVVTLLVAWWTRSVLAIALGGIVGASIHCLLSHLMLPGPGNRFRWDRTAVWDIVHFGKWVFLSTVISFFALQIDKLVFARLFPLDQVGVYAIAASLAIMTPMLMGRLQTVIAFPLYARMLDRNESLADVVMRSKPPMLLAGAYLVTAAIVCAQSFVDLAYDDRYAAAGAFIMILSVGAWFAIIDGIYGAAFLASGRAHWVAAVNATKVVSFCLLLGPAVAWGGLLGAVWAAALSDLIKLGLAMILARRIQLLNLWAELRYTAAMAGAVGLILGLTTQFSALAHLHPAWRLLVQAVLVTAMFGWPLAGMARDWLQRSRQA
jgi:O-antigen/teichoic acid export membrane protein